MALRNDGNVHIKPKAQVYIQSLGGKTLYKGTLKRGAPVFPGGTENYQGAIHKFELRPGIYKALIDVDFTNLGKNFKKGIYFGATANGAKIVLFYRKPKA